MQALDIYHKQTKKIKHNIEYMSQDSCQNGIAQQLCEVIQNYPIQEDFKTFLDSQVKYLFKVEMNLKAQGVTERLKSLLDKAHSR
ncbi:hypothetical protein [Microcystis wesenbergii]|uniref:hypothetical protein n=1 Tax=Microcystis wesenbergii TaxID=44823 RepID=UPI0035E3DF3E